MSTFDNNSSLKASVQAAFDKACAGLLEQGCRSVSGSSCKYRSILHMEGGRNVCLKCAIGQLLTDEQIKKYSILEGMTVGNFPGALFEELVPGYSSSYNVLEQRDVRDFLYNLQQAHDFCVPDPEGSTFDFNEKFTRRANLVAYQYNLTPIQSKPNA